MFESSDPDDDDEGTVSNIVNMGYGAFLSSVRAIKRTGGGGGSSPSFHTD